MAKLRAQSDPAPFNANEIGMPTLTSHGAFSTFALL
jgi:hypothetical protein